MNNNEYILEVRDISKSFPGVKALDHARLQVRLGTVHTLMGENGAGKSTLMKCIYGMYKPDEGEIFINGTKVDIGNPRHAMDLGISMIHQELHPVRSQTVSENVFLGRIPYRKRCGIRFVNRKTLYDDTEKIFHDLDISVSPKEKMGNLSTAYCQLIEIARAVSFGAKIIIMDEPTSSLTETEAEILFRIIRQLKEKNVAIIYISHKIDEILRVSDEITIMRDGIWIGTYPAAEMTTDSIVNKMVGRKMDNRFPVKSYKPSDEICFRTENLTSVDPHSFQNVSFDVRKGEIFGIGGLVGSQRSELVEAIFGLRPIQSGEIWINQERVSIRQPIDAIKHGIAFLTEDRRKTGVLGPLSITDNILTVQQNLKPQDYKSYGLIDRRKRDTSAQDYVDSLSIKTASLKTTIQTLSGGNQQKVLLGRWMLTEPDILILDEPTRGIDVGAKYEIYELMESIAKAGKCVIMISSEMPELMGISDRIMVMCEGHVSGIVEGCEATEEKIMYMASTYEQ